MTSFEIFKDKFGGFRFRLKAKNGDCRKIGYLISGGTIYSQKFSDVMNTYYLQNMIYISLGNRF